MGRPLGHFVLLLATIWVTICSATICKDDIDCPHHHLCFNNKCSRGVTGTGQPCLNSSNCLDQSNCWSRECSCDQNIQSYSCLDGETCLNGICTGRTSDCVTSVDCEDNKICHKFKCIYCDKSSQCPDDQVCVDGKCDTLIYCRTTTDCPGGRRCIFNSCAYPTTYGPCEDDQDCPADQRCRPYMCVKRETSSPLSDVLIWLVGLSIALLAKLCIIKHCSYSSNSNSNPSDASSLLSAPAGPGANSPLISTSRAISVPNLSLPSYSIQMASSAPSSESSFDSKPPTYSEVCCETPEPPPEYEGCSTNFH